MNRVMVAALLLVAWVGAARAQESDETAWTTVSLEALGLTPAVQTYHTDPGLQFSFATRGDQVLTAARLTLDMLPDTEALEAVESLTVLLNDVEVQTLSVADLATRTVHEVPIDSRLLAETNQLTLRFDLPETDPCGASVAAGTWAVLQGGALQTLATSLPLDDDLSILPLPFYDPNTDVEARIAVGFLGELDRDTLHAGALVAGWFGLLTGSKVRFPVTVGAIPDERGVVLFAGDPATHGLDLPPPQGPTVALIPHPRADRANAKLLVIYGPDTAAVHMAVSGLLLSPVPLVGPSIVYDGIRPPPILPAYRAPRWLPPVDEVRFGDVAGGDALVHQGLQGGTMALDFRIAPDLFAWPRDLLRVEVDYLQMAPPGDARLIPTIIVALNGKFVTRLPRVAGGDGTRSERLELHRSQVRGFNRLQFHVRWPDEDRVCDEVLGERVETRILPSSALHFDGTPHFVQLPNVESFVEDGYPFTRRPDLADTAVVLSAAPKPGELGTFLSLMAHFAAVTGTAAHHVSLPPESEIDRAAIVDKDLLVIGDVSHVPAMTRWVGRLPVDLTGGRFRVRHPELAQQALDLLGGHLSGSEADAIERQLASSGDAALVMGAASPLHPDRNLVVVSASSERALPAAPDIVGFTNASEGGGDVIVVVGGAPEADKRWRYRVQRPYHQGELPAFTRLRWSLANHWLILVPALWAGVALLARAWRAQLSWRERERLAEALELDG